MGKLHVQKIVRGENKATAIVPIRITETIIQVPVEQPSISAVIEVAADVQFPILSTLRFQGGKAPLVPPLQRFVRKANAKVPSRTTETKNQGPVEQPSSSAVTEGAAIQDGTRLAF